jgi:ATP-binding cassette, subfamily G (WHITE), member 2, SNQ2
LRELADKAGQAILCTIHQPSGELFQVFDRLLLLKVGGQTVYFGDLGYNSSILIEYFERHGARRCKSEENPYVIWWLQVNRTRLIGTSRAEYILQVIGAGATATVDRDWHQVWKDSPEAQDVQRQIEAIHEEGRIRPAVETTLHSEFATSWPYQVITLIHRDFLGATYSLCLV